MNMETMPKRRPGRPKSKTSIQSTTAKSAKTNQILRICINRLTKVNCYVGCTDSNKIKKEPADFKLDAICHGTELEGLEELIKRETQTNGNTEHKALDEEVENAEENNRVAPSEFSPCPYCTTSFTNPSYLEQHVKYHHREEYRGMVRRQSARQHPKAAPMHNCPQCVCVFHTSKQLTVHKNKAHPTAPPLKLYPCPTCARSFDYLRNLKNHCQRWHKMMVYMRDGEIRCSKCRKSLGKTWGQGPHKCTKSKSNASELENMKPISLVIGVQCSECGKTLGSPQSLAKHMVVHTGEKPHVCKDCGKAFSGLSSLRGHMLIHSGAKPYSCQVCGSSFPEMYRLRVHMGKHTGEKAFSCSECKKTFSFRGCLTRHLQTHFKVKCHFCPKCDKSFTSQDNLKYHLRIHNKSHQCGECGLKVSSFQVLKTHMRMHTDERPYHCKLCEKQFRRLEHLKNHQRTHSGEKPYKCDTCASSFSQSGDLAKHKRRHTGEKPFACSVCSKAFICSGALTLHMRIHSDERPFKCQECGMDFRTNPGLRSHKKIHTGERPYHCPHCEGRFKRLDHLKTHVGRCPNK